jgi:hypothetical protein
LPARSSRAANACAARVSLEFQIALDRLHERKPAFALPRKDAGADEDLVHNGPENGPTRTTTAREARREAIVRKNEDPVSVVLNLMKPAQPGGRTADEKRLTRENEPAGGAGVNALER